ncbi:phage tail tape measure protein [Oceanobacter mangrovi]|uniref:phage tail tape measure protein n=1 Tax=Oceanobacter mangrovi TaxID=2862510 RepID=UPI001C8DE4FB|nr:phage tail tape measure protein [Oceanobacter mangrovi]
MSVTALEKLMFTVGMTDQASGPLGNISKSLDGVKRNANAGFDAIRGGAIGMGAAFFSIKTLMEPVHEMDNALGEVRSLGVIDSELATLKKSALDFSVQYGESAADFVRSSYDIQSAIGGLTNGELAKFTEASNVLAKGTKADAATITGYMGTMYGIFQDQANKMGKAQWVEQLTGQTALAVQMFKTTGSQMSGAFSALGATAKSAGVDISEQIAILGTLQASMSGSEAATKYRAFLENAGKAQEKLGLQFTDSQGRLLPMVEILGRINNKYSNLTDVSQSGALKDAFGSGEAVALISGLIDKTDGLSASITKLGRNTGMQNAADMASEMVDPWDQFEAVTKGVRIAFGSALLPTINDVLGTMTDGLTVVMGWTQEFPHLTKWIGLATLGVLLLTGAVGFMSMVVGIGRAAWAGMLFLGTVAKVIWGLARMVGILRVGWMAMSAVIAITTSPLWGTVALIAAVGAVLGWLVYKVGEYTGAWKILGKWFDQFHSWMETTEWGQAILEKLEKIKAYVVGLIDDFKELVDFDFSFSDLNPFSDSPEIQPLSDNKAASDLPSVRQSVAGMVSGTGGTHWGGVTINADGGMSPADLEQWAQLNGG